MYERMNREDEPLCRFGPGGDYVSFWPGEGEEINDGQSQQLTRLLTGLAEIIGAITGTGQKGKLDYAVKEDDGQLSVDAETATIIKGDFRIQDEPMLFTDDRGTGGRTGHKPKHRIRTHKRTSKKRSSSGQSGQGTLFEADFKSTRIA